MYAVTNATETYLLVAWQAAFRRHELYTGSIKELGNLGNDDRLRKATACGFAGNQRERRNRNNLEAEYQSIVSGADQLVAVMKLL